MELAINIFLRHAQFWIYLHNKSKEGGKGVIRDALLSPKLTCDVWILQSSERDSWIYKAAWGVICLLRHTWPVFRNFIFHFVRFSRFLWHLAHRKTDLKAPFSIRAARNSVYNICDSWICLKVVRETASRLPLATLSKGLLQGGAKLQK